MTDVCARWLRSGLAAALCALLASCTCAGSGGDRQPARPVEVLDGGAPPDAGPAPASSSRLDYAVLGSAAKVRPDGRAEGSPDAELFAARNEFESFQVAVNAGAEPVRGLTVAFAGPLLGPQGAVIGEDHLTVYRVGYYDVHTPSDTEGAPGRWPDPLIPTVDRLVGEARNAFPVDVPAGENRVAWIDLQVPVDATPGEYHGVLELRAAGDLRADVAVRLTVLAFTLPSTTTLKSAFGLHDHTCTALGLEGCGESDLRARTKSLFVRSALDNRMTISYAHTTRVLEGSELGREEFRTHTLPFVEGTAPTRLPGARLTTYQVNRHKDREVAGWRELARAHGFTDRAFVYACDEPHFFPVYGDPLNNWEVCRAELEAQHATWPEAQKLVTTHIQSVSQVGLLWMIDILVLNVELLHGPEGTPWHVGNQRPLYDEFLSDSSRPKELWLYTACGSHGCSRNDDPYSVGWAGYDIDAPASQTRAMAWLAFLYWASGTLYFATGTSLATAWDDQYRFTGNGDGNLFYPGTPDRIGGTRAIPIESLRMKLVRDGYEDYEYLAFLREQGQGPEAERIGRELFPAPFETTATDEEVQSARRELARRVAAITGGPSP